MRKYKEQQLSYSLSIRRLITVSYLSWKSDECSIVLLVRTYLASSYTQLSSSRLTYDFHSRRYMKVIWDFRKDPDVITKRVTAGRDCGNAWNLAVAEKMIDDYMFRR